MGCPNNWGTDEQGGSDVPCVDIGRIVKDGDNEDQKNGTYYHFQAASVGTGSAITTNNANVPDTFCPLGWQLPYGGTAGEYYNQSKSWKYLFDNYSVTYDNGDAIQATKIRSYPFSYIYSGLYHLQTGRLYQQNNYGGYWSSVIGNDSSAGYRLIFGLKSIQVSASVGKNNAQAIRCVTRN